MGDVPTPKSATRCPQKGWSLKNGTMTDGTPALRPAAVVPAQVVVMDNATFHKGGRIEQLIEDVGCQVIYLPPYSPDLNKIEQCWSWLKSRIRKQLVQVEYMFSSSTSSNKLNLKDSDTHAFCILVITEFANNSAVLVLIIGTTLAKLKYICS
jgi:hypothetical protein